jgi:hypothetical protein
LFADEGFNGHGLIYVAVSELPAMIEENHGHFRQDNLKLNFIYRLSECFLIQLTRVFDYKKLCEEARR